MPSDTRVLQDDTTGDGKEFVMLIVHYCWISLLFMILGVTGGRLMHYLCFHQPIESVKKTCSGKQGLFTHADWPLFLRGPLALFFVLVFVVPLVMMLVSLVLGAVLAAFEDWEWNSGIEDVVSNVLGMQDPLTNITPTSTSGMLVDILLSIWSLLLVTTAMGIAAGMSLFTSMTDSMPSSIFGFFRYLFIYIPAFMILLSMLTGAIMASIEDWSYEDGFLFMAGVFADLANPLTDDAPDTPKGCFFEVMCISVEICLGGAVIGVVGAHPCTQSLIAFIEGVISKSDRQETAPLADDSTSEVAKLRAEVASLKAELLKVQGQTNGSDVRHCQSLNDRNIAVPADRYGASTSLQDLNCVVLDKE